jgi:hypothetical protein
VFTDFVNHTSDFFEYTLARLPPAPEDHQIRLKTFSLPLSRIAVEEFPAILDDFLSNPRRNPEFPAFS